ncbi:uncharacterized protein LOC131293168 [Anopheles ziemanni]|uniref:uncharacterized protein LOC131264076 n=1 Tax=Anopheles coustani TaxID=139045 RepID=UPI00265A1D56|nr:uncharacterized protein LOC131264076 [Anopheles coustani]XP_058177230.1 uncharacterized protein LOC131293168 [Anopheles ziemanni]
MATIISIRRLPPEEIGELRGLYRVDWPKHAFTFYTLDNFFRWRKWFQNDKVQLYTDLNQDWRESGTFLAKWEYNEPMFVNLPGRLIDRNPSLGAYDLEGHLVAWCLIDQTGSLALFQTVAAHQRKGLGRAIIDRFSKQLHKDGILPQALIVDSNVPSRSLFEKLNFNAVDNWCWTRFDKIIENQTEK